MLNSTYSNFTPTQQQLSASADAADAADAAGISENERKRKEALKERDEIYMRVR